MSKQIEMFSPQKNIDDMNYDELRAFVKKFYNIFERFRREYVDTLENLDEDNFSGQFVKERNGMKTAIKVNAEGIKTKVSNEEFESTIKQTAESISSIVSEFVDVSQAAEVNSPDKFTDKSKIYVIRERDTDGNVVTETFYHYNTISKDWKPISADGIIYSLFEQREDGFYLKGNVKVDGSCILTDSLTFDSSDNPLQVEYSVDGMNNWHTTFVSGSDKFMRLKIGAKWSDAMKIVGTDGQDGAPGDDADVTFTKVNAALGYLYKTASGDVPTRLTGSYVYSPNVLGGKFYAGSGDGFSKMDENGFDVYDKNGDNKIGIGYKDFGTTYPHLTLGVGAGYASDGAGLIYKLGNGLWIGDASVLALGGDYPGAQTSVTDISSVHPYATGIFIDFYHDNIWQYVNGVPSTIGSGGGIAVAVFG